jgi:hypothetical protein
MSDTDKITSIDSLVDKALQAVKDFGIYQAQDKGFREVMDMGPVGEYFKNKPGAEAGKELATLLDNPKLTKDNIAGVLVMGIIDGLEDMDPEWFDALIESDPRLTDIY